MVANRLRGSFGRPNELRTDQIKPAPEFNGSIDSTYITGLGTVKSGDSERMLILMDIEQLMSSAEMGLMDQFTH